MQREAHGGWGTLLGCLARLGGAAEQTHRACNLPTARSAQGTPQFLCQTRGALCVLGRLVWSGSPAGASSAVCDRRIREAPESCRGLPATDGTRTRPALLARSAAGIQPLPKVIDHLQSTCQPRPRPGPLAPAGGAAPSAPQRSS